MEISMKTLKNYLKIAFFAIIILSVGLKASSNDAFGENVAKAVLLKWSPKPEHIKASNYTNIENQDTEYATEETSIEDED